jgi:hypothetical protein
VTRAAAIDPVLPLRDAPRASGARATGPSPGKLPLD